MSKIELYSEKIFDDIKHIDENGKEYWEARELMPLLEYSKWENFHQVIKKAMIACTLSNNASNYHFPEFRKPIVGGKGNIQNVGPNLSKYPTYDIAKRKGLRYREDILDNMGSDELIANLFRISQTEQNLKRDNVQGESNACITHKKIGKIVRKAIKEAGGIMPENMPTPEKSLKELEKLNNSKNKEKQNIHI